MTPTSNALSAAILARKAQNRIRYERRYARHTPTLASKRRPAERTFSAAARSVCVIRGVPEYLQEVVRAKYGAKGTWGHGRYAHATKKGPGRRRIPLIEQTKRAGSKLIRRFFEKLA